MSSGFVTEAEVQEARRIRQEEWEKVRKPDQPIGKDMSGPCRQVMCVNNFLFTEAPEVPYDGRSLYERLKEQKDKKDSDYEETHKLSEFYWNFKELFIRTFF